MDHRRSALLTHTAALAIVSGALVLSLSARAQDKKPIGMLLAAGDIAQCLTPAEKKSLSSADPKKKEKKEAARNKSGAATADLIRQEIAKAKKDHPNIETRILALGDLFYPHGESSDCFNETWGEFKAQILPTPGNHDFETKSGAAYFAYFKPTLDAAKADAKLATYAVDFPSPASLAPGEKPWRLFALNSNNPNADQRKWLEGELSKIEKPRCVLAFSHAFLYSSGRHGHADRKGPKPEPQNSKIDTKMPLLPGNMEKMFRILHAGHGSVFLAGHDHHYEQLGPASADGQPGDRGTSAMVKGGVRSFIVGVGGTRLHSEHPKGNDYDDKWAFQEASDLKSRGILRIMLYPTSYAWAFVATKDNSASFKAIKGVKFEDDCNRP
jgi:acid phosphatase type 7